MPHPVPANPASIEGWRYYLVAIPDDDVAVSAAWDAYSELMNYWAWGLEGPEANSDAMAQVWADALYETIRLRQMGFPDVILTYIDEVESLLRLIADSNYCCDQLPGSGTIIGETEGDLPASDTDVGAEEWPTGITSQSEWDIYICNAAAAYVDRLIGLPPQIARVTSWSVGALTALVLWFTGGAYIALAGIAFITIAQVFELLAILEELLDAITGGTEDSDLDVVADLEAVRDDLICAIVTANDYQEATTNVRAIIESSVSLGWASVLFFWATDAAMAAIFEGQSTDAPDATCPNCLGTPSAADRLRGVFFKANASSAGASWSINRSVGIKCGAGDWLFGSFAAEETFALGDAEAVAAIVADNENSTGCAAHDGLIGIRLVASAGAASNSFEIMQAYDTIDNVWRNVQTIAIQAQSGAAFSVDGRTIHYSTDASLQSVDITFNWAI